MNLNFIIIAGGKRVGVCTWFYLMEMILVRSSIINKDNYSINLVLSSGICAEFKVIKYYSLLWSIKLDFEDHLILFLLMVVSFTLALFNQDKRFWFMSRINLSVIYCSRPVNIKFRVMIIDRWNVNNWWWLFLFTVVLDRFFSSSKSSYLLSVLSLIGF